MDRLTMTSGKGGLAFTFDLDITCEKSEILKIQELGKRLKQYEDLDLEPSQLAEIDRLYQSKCEEVVALKKEVAEYQQKLADGRMVELPCKVGDFVYVLMQRNTVIEIVTGTVTNVSRFEDGVWYVEFSDLWLDVKFEDFGKTAFLTKEKAEQALKETKQSENPCLACGCDCYNSEVGGCEMPSEDLMFACPLEVGDK
ncbi:MAG TPA: hypothetical protein VHO70_13660 [Chitinispirillaceae bacterium]|nr:hypothetical protein [Chitinispirillaceae bacterium]